jgi:hypothetical protein
MHGEAVTVEIGDFVKTRAGVDDELKVLNVVHRMPVRQ